MSNILKYKNRGEIASEASLWVVRLDAENFSAQEREQLIAWLRESEHHQKAFCELALLWNKMGVLSQLSDVFPFDEQAESPATARQRFARWRPAVAATVAAMVLISTVFLFSADSLVEQQNSLTSTQSYETQVGKQQTVNLPDGSTVKLNTASKILVEFEASQRNIKLLQGEAHFEVSHDPNRPFKVHVGTNTVTAVGTAFNVRVLDSSIKVIVTEGKVKVSTNTDKSRLNTLSTKLAQSPDRETSLGAGQAIELVADVVQVDVQPPEAIAKELSWQHNVLMFKGDLLEDAVREINRYTNIRVEINDPEIKDIRVGGLFKIGETQAMLDAFETSFDIKVQKVNEHLIYLSKASR